MKVYEFLDAVHSVRYKNWLVRNSILQTEGDGPYYEKDMKLALVWVEFNAPDVDTGQMDRQVGRQWAVTDPQETWHVVDTLFKAIKNAEEHEVKENFYYKGKRIFDPHKNYLEGM